MPGYRLIPAVEADIEEALTETLTTYGFAKYADYALLIQEALEALAANPRAGKRREYIHPDAWTHVYAGRQLNLIRAWYHDDLPTSWESSR